MLAASVLIGLVILTGAASVWWNLKAQEFADAHLVGGAHVLQDELDRAANGLLDLSAIIANDQDLVQALQADRADALGDQLRPFLGVQDVSWLAVATADGRVVSVVGKEPVGAAPSVPGNPWSRTTLRGRPASGLTKAATGPPQVEVLHPITLEDGGPPTHVVMLVSALDVARLSRLSARMNLHLSMSFQDEPGVTTLPGQEGPIVGMRQVPEVQEAVVGRGDPIFHWSTTASESYRSYAVPLKGPDGSRVGVMSLALRPTDPSNLRSWPLPVLLAGLFFVVTMPPLVYASARQLQNPARSLWTAQRRLRRQSPATPLPPAPASGLRLTGERASPPRSVTQHLTPLARGRNLFATLREPILVASPDGKITDFTLAAVALFGDPNLDNKTIWELIPFAPGPEAEGPSLTVRQGHIVNPEGEVIDVEVSRTRLPAGRLAAEDVYIVHDITEHVRISRSREQLLYSVAHELRTPLSVLENNLDLLVNEYLALPIAEVNQLFASAHRIAVRLRVLLEGLLSEGSIQAGRLRIRPEPIDIRVAVAEALDIVGPMMKDRGQKIKVRVRALRVMADPTLLRQVLVNLLNNASKYGEPGQPITICAIPRVRTAVVAVRDSGQGVPRDQQRRLFERFYRATAGEAMPGTGLGLAIVKEIVEAHGGTVNLYCGQDGTVVWLTLGLCRSPRGHMRPVDAKC